METIPEGSDPVAKRICPTPPPLPGPATTYSKRSSIRCVPTATTDLWERLFDEGYRADVCVQTENGGIIYAHANILVS